MDGGVGGGGGGVDGGELYLTLRATMESLSDGDG